MADALLQTVTDLAVTPALHLFPAVMDSTAARVMLLAIGLQESGFVTRRQRGGGPARGWWQFEPGSAATRGGVTGVLLHAATSDLAAQLCTLRHCTPRARSVWERLEQDDVLAAGFARLMLFTDRCPLPALTDVRGAWACYAERTWRPGKPRPDEWPGNYMRALQFVTGGAA